MTAQPRLRSFLFAVQREYGGSRFAIFWALNVAAAKRYARAWAEERGFTIELVPDEAVA
jgi:hypothetical protein